MQSFSTAYANLYSNHFSIILRIGITNAKFKTTFLKAQNRKHYDDDESKENNLDIEIEAIKKFQQSQKESRNDFKNDCEVSDIYELSLSKHDVNTLYKNQWISYHIVDVFFIILRNQFPQIHAFTTLFYKEIKLCNSNRHFKQLRKFTNNINIFQKDMIMVPICDPNRWALMVIDLSLKNKCYIKIYDPLKDSSSDKELMRKNTEIIVSMKNFLSMEYQKNFAMLYQVNFDQKIIPGNLVDEFHESGPNILAYAKYIVFKTSFQYILQNWESFRGELLRDFYAKKISPIKWKTNRVKEEKNYNDFTSQQQSSASTKLLQKHQLKKSNISTKNNYVKNNKTKIEVYLEDIGLEKINVKGDGNCFFRALVPYSQLTQDQLRYKIVEKMRENPKVYAALYTEPYCEQYSIICENITATNIFDRITQMYKDRQWAGFIERFAAAFYFHKNIVELHQYSENTWYWKIFVCETDMDAFESWQQKESIFLFFKPPHFEILKMKGQSPKMPTLNNQSKIYLLYQLSEEYPSIFECLKPNQLL